MKKEVNLKSLNKTVSKIDALLNELEKMQNDTDYGFQQYNKEQLKKQKQERGVK